uniref:Uncharacterized protein n=1 Tax=Glossina austeni TaxID=7395 RepID=A0A1A9VDK2_GLOAU
MLCFNNCITRTYTTAILHCGINCQLILRFTINSNIQERTKPIGVAMITKTKTIMIDFNTMSSSTSNNNNNKCENNIIIRYAQARARLVLIGLMLIIAAKFQLFAFLLAELV